MPASMREAQGQDWLEDLREFGPAVVAEACARWRRTESRRPAPADIRKLAIEEQENYGPRRLPGPEIADEDIWVAANKYAREHGFSCIEAYQAAGHSAVLKIGRATHRFPSTKLETVQPERAPLVRGFDTASSLGVTAREWTPEEMARGRRALGLERYPDEPAQSDD